MTQLLINELVCVFKRLHKDIYLDGKDMPYIFDLLISKYYSDNLITEEENLTAEILIIDYPEGTTEITIPNKLDGYTVTSIKGEHYEQIG